MAAATVASTGRPRVVGDFKVMFVSFTSLGSGETFTVPGGSSVNVLGAIPVNRSTSTDVSFTVSGQTVTANVSSGTPNVTAAIFIGA